MIVENGSEFVDVSHFGKSLKEKICEFPLCVFERVKVSRAISMKCIMQTFQTPPSYPRVLMGRKYLKTCHLLRLCHIFLQKPFHHWQKYRKWHDTFTAKTPQKHAFFMILDFTDLNLSRFGHFFTSQILVF